MKRLQVRLQEEAKRHQVRQDIIERDYAQSYILYGLSQVASLREHLVFKGGTALKKSYFEDYRFSEDLDFSVHPTWIANIDSSLQHAMEMGSEAANLEGSFRFVLERYEERDPHPLEQDAFVIRVQFPWHRQPLIPIKLEITHSEPVPLPPTGKKIFHGYEEKLEAQLKTYALEEVIAEKLRATVQSLTKLEKRGWVKPRARDFYDLWHLAKLPTGSIRWDEVLAILPKKCEARQVRIQSWEDVFAPRLLAEVRKSWQATLGDFVSQLPNVDQVLFETQRMLQDRMPCETFSTKEK